MAEPATQKDWNAKSSPAKGFAAVTKSDTVSYTHPGGTPLLARGLYVGGAGDVVLVDQQGNAVTFSAVPAGTILPVEHIRVDSTNTTATLMVRLD